MAKFLIAKDDIGRELILGQLDDDSEIMDIIGTPSVSDADEDRVARVLGDDATYHVVER